MNDLFRGERVRLSAFDPEELGKAYARWNTDSEFARLLDGVAPRLHSAKAIGKFLEKEVEDQPPAAHYFGIRTLTDDRLVGDLELDVTSWNHRDAFVGIGLGSRDDWGRGYGTEALRLALRFAFLELGLRRVSLTVFEYNPRAVRSYEKAGFRLEGRMRQILNREGRRWDVLYMAILKDEWMEQNGNKN
ncbi:MAG: GNAT family N-acetyltransferase [Chloroflexota bacterium]